MLRLSWKPISILRPKSKSLSLMWMMGTDDSKVSQKEISDEVIVDSDKKTDGVEENRKKNHDDDNVTEDCLKEGIARRIS